MGDAQHNYGVMVQALTQTFGESMNSMHEKADINITCVYMTAIDQSEVHCI
jgi:hypothetical protein